MENKLIRLKQFNDHMMMLKSQQGIDFLPVQGWVRTIRKLLGMTIKQLAKRVGCDPSRVVKIEMSECEGAVTLRTMRILAEKLDCFFAYQFLPKISLEKIIKNRAREIAAQTILRTAHTMNLEAQTVHQEWLEEQIADMTRELLHKSWKHLWEE